MGSAACTGTDVSTNNASNALRTCHLKMALILDHIPRTPLLEGVDYWPKSATREQWFALTRDLVASTIAEMGEYLDDAELSVVQEHFIKGGLL